MNIIKPSELKAFLLNADLRQLLLIISVFYWCNSIAQKTVSKIMDSGKVDEINILGASFYKIDIYTHQEDQIEVKVQFEGEYFDQQNVQIRNKPESLFIGMEWNPGLIIPDDKLSAHKINAARLSLTMPQHLNLNATGKSGTIAISGIFNMVKLDLEHMNCHIDGLAKKAYIRTSAGDIVVRTQNAVVDARTRKGKIYTSEVMKGSAKWKLRSIDGNIRFDPQE